MQGPTSAQTSRQRPSLPQVTTYFLWLGTVGFGGPIALAGRMQRDLVDTRSWLTNDEYLEGLALAQLAPGPLAAQLAIYLGYILHGVLGATVIGFAFIGPSFVMVLALAAAYVRFGGLPWMQAVFYGVGAAAIGIITRSALKLVKTTLKRDFLLWSISILLFLTTAITQREIAWLFVGGGLISLAVKAPPRAMSFHRAMLLPAFDLSAIGTSKALEIFGFFAKAGLFVFGSGLAIVPFLHGGVVLEHHWLTEKEFLDAVAVAMITPGPVVITVAFIGYLVSHTAGAVAAALGVFLPVYLVVVCFAPFYRRHSTNPQIRAFVQGVTAAAVGAIAGAAVVLARGAIRDAPTLIIAITTLLLLMKSRIPEPLLIAGSAFLGLIVRSVR